MIRRCEFERALAVIHRSGVHTDLELIMRPPDKGGRPRALRVDVFCAAVMSTIALRKTGTLLEIHDVLTTELARSYQVSLGIRPPGKNAQPITVRQVRYMLEALERKLSASQGRTPDLDPLDRLQRKAAVQNIADKLLDATMPMHIPYSNVYALDATAIDTFARGTGHKNSATTSPGGPDGGSTEAAPTAERTRSHDPDASWGYRTKTEDNKSHHVFGYQLVAFAPVNYPGPTLIHRLTLAPGNSSGVTEALEVLERTQNSTPQISKLLSDRAFSNTVAENWKYKLRDQGIAQTLDINPNMHGPRDFEGVIMLDGTPHCPRTPQQLHIIKRPANLSAGELGKKATPEEILEHQQRAEALSTFRSAIADRQDHAFRRVAGPDATGKERWECPAQAGTLSCTRCPVSQHLPAGTPIVDTPPTDAEAPKACTQRTITVPGDVSAKLRQAHYWGSDAWIAEYNLRARIEGTFGNIKGSDTERVKRGWIRVVGHLKMTIMLTLAVVTSNLRQLRTWAAGVGDFTDPLTTIDPPDLGFEELEDPEDDEPSNTGPPGQ